MPQHAMPLLYRAIFVLLLAVLGTAALAADDRVPRQQLSAIVFDARVIAGEGETEVQLDVTDDVHVSAFMTQNPNRLVLDMVNVGFALDASRHGRGEGAVSAFRYGLFGDGRSRVVFDLDRALRVADRRVVPIPDGARISFLLREGDAKASVVRPMAGLTGSLAARATPAKSDRAEAPIANPSRVANGGTLRIVIDPGHGGLDPGGVRGDLLEKDIVLGFSKELRDAFAASPAFEVWMTREDDSRVSLKDRVAFAREKQAHLMISVHADTVRQSYVRGATIYTIDETASDAQAAAFAARENAADMLAGLPVDDEDAGVADILFDLTRRETKNFSILYARGLAEQLRRATKLNKNPLRRASLKVLRAPDVPSILLELGYLSNEEDAARLLDADWRAATVARIVTATAEHFGADTRLAGGDQHQ